LDRSRTPPNNTIIDGNGAADSAPTNVIRPVQNQITRAYFHNRANHRVSVRAGSSITIVRPGSRFRSAIAFSIHSPTAA
jgi:hypothetical protein